MRALRYSVLVSSLLLGLFACRQGERGDIPLKGPSRAVSVKESSDPSVVQGKAVYDESGCATCHSVGGIGGTIGPALDGVGDKYGEEELREILLNPQVINPTTTMPPFEGSEEELEALIAYLKSLKGERASSE